MIEDRLQQVVEAEKRARDQERLALSEAVVLQEERGKAREAEDLRIRSETAEYKEKLEAENLKRIQSDRESLEKNYLQSKSALEISARQNQDALISWLWEEVLIRYGGNADAETSAHNNA